MMTVTYLGLHRGRDGVGRAFHGVSHLLTERLLRVGLRQARNGSGIESPTITYDIAYLHGGGSLVGEGLSASVGHGVLSG